ncbi:MAG TPA: DUF1643 domain-containing protein [Candidatus Limnocylindria bacterium]|nr:DUF1643 domain-containing protein [Candidatus Limnocylindria bacterium]
MHVPRGRIEDETLLGFRDALRAPAGEPYDETRWLYVPPFYAEYRYVLGTLGGNPIICVGLNPSTARPDALDRTLQSVQRMALSKGYDSFLMMNLYAQRATRPRDMDPEVHGFLHAENLKAFRYLLGRTKTVWTAWGAVMETRAFLRSCVRDFARVGAEEGAQWFTAGELSRGGHPHHPLFLSTRHPMEPFDVAAYAATLKEDHAG